MNNEIPPADETAVSRVVRFFLTGIAILLLVPPWGIITLFYSVRIIQEYERAVVFRLGRLVGARGPGLIFLLPLIDRMVRVDLRTVSEQVPAQETITRDNVTVKVDAVIYYRVVSPELTVVSVLDYKYATSHMAQTTLRSVLGSADLDELLTQREQVNQRLQQIIDDHTEPWGIKVTAVEVKDLELPEGMQRAMARQAEAERERRAKVIHAQGEFEASEQLAQAGRVMAENPSTLQLRYLQTLTEIAVERNSTIIFPMPMDILAPFLRAAAGQAGTSPAP